MPTTLFLDTEFTDFRGELISLALVSQDREFYEVLELPPGVRISKWVRENVLPKLQKDPVPIDVFRSRLCDFLNSTDRPFVVIADWPADFKYLCDALEASPGEMLDVSVFMMRLVTDLAVASDLPHNALHDARALRDAYLQ